jgi:dTDP-4-dehydrorhamnose 3,5-epimerase
MDGSRFLIIGAYGQLGKALQAKYPKATPVDRDTFDITNWEMLAKYDWSKIDLIFNAAVYANVDGAETPEGRETAWLVNAVGPSYLSNIATKHNLTLVHFSTDYVFDGTKAPHLETEHYSPLGVYAQTKATGDIVVSMTPKHYIFRISWLIGDGPNFVRTMINLAEKSISPDVVSDEIGRPTFTTTLVEGIDHVLRTKASYGIYNSSGDGEPVSWADISRATFKELGRDDLQVTNITGQQYVASKPVAARRPTGSALDLTKAKAIGLPLRDWRQDLHDYIQAEMAKTKE